MSFNAIIRDRVKILKIISLPNSFIELIPLKFIKGLKTKFQCGDFFLFSDENPHNIIFKHLFGFF